MKYIDKYSRDLDFLIDKGEKLYAALELRFNPEVTTKYINKVLKDGKKNKEYIASLPDFRTDYQSWYSESLVLIKQVLPDRLSDFKKYYEKPKSRREIEYGNYVIEDGLQDLVVEAGFARIVGPEAISKQFLQQLNIVKSIKRRFESSLYDIKQLVQADIFDSELDAARELNKNKFVRAAGAVAGVILEKHLNEIVINHNIKLPKKNPSISDYNDLLKSSEIYDIITWRFIQHLADIRNLCDHKKEREPKKDEVDDLIAGVDKIIKTIY